MNSESDNLESNRPVGRPTLYKKEFAEQYFKLCLLGHTDEEVASFFDVSVATIYNWKNEHPEFLEAEKRSKVEADGDVVVSLYRRACGYSHEAVKIFNNDGQALIVPYTEHYPPDTAAAFIWLKNRQGKAWRDKSEVEVSINEDLANRLEQARKAKASDSDV